MWRIIPLFFLFVNTLSADWNPATCFPGQDLSCLNNAEFQDLKKKINEELEKSWCTKEKIELLMDLVLLSKPHTCVEIGVFGGSSVLPVASVLRYLNTGTLFAIDAWSNDEAVKYMHRFDPNISWWNWVPMGEAYLNFIVRLNMFNLNSCCQILCMTSEDAASLFSDEEIDFIHLDGNYTEVGSVKDALLYLPKVKAGGYILLSDRHMKILGEFTKKKSFHYLYNACDIIAEIDYGNAVLFRKR